jgi:hypothetical protein
MICEGEDIFDRWDRVLDVLEKMPLESICTMFSDDEEGRMECHACPMFETNGCTYAANSRYNKETFRAAFVLGARSEPSEEFARWFKIPYEEEEEVCV